MRKCAARREVVAGRRAGGPVGMGGGGLTTAARVAPQRRYPWYNARASTHSRAAAHRRPSRTPGQPAAAAPTVAVAAAAAVAVRWLSCGSQLGTSHGRHTMPPEGGRGGALQGDSGAAGAAGAASAAGAAGAAGAAAVQRAAWSAHRASLGRERAERTERVVVIGGVTRGEYDVPGREGCGRMRREREEGVGESHLRGEAEEGGRGARRAPLRPLDEPWRRAQRRRRLCLPVHVGGTLTAAHRLGERSESGHDEEVRLARSRGGGARRESLAASGSWLQGARAQGAGQRPQA